MSVISGWKIRRLERRIIKWKAEGQRLVIDLVKINEVAHYLKEWSLEALDEFRVEKIQDD